MLSLRPLRPRALNAIALARNTSSNAEQQRRRFWHSRRRYVAVGALGISTTIGIWAWCKTDKDRPLSLHSFSPVQIVSSEPTGSNTKLLHLKIPERILSNVSFPPPIWSIFIKDSDIQIERPFTPLEGVPDDNGELELWVKKYTDSEMGRWIHSRPVGESIEIREPHQTWAWKENTWHRVVMISGGTGVTPFHQLLHYVFSKKLENASTEFVLLHAYRSVDEIPPTSVMQNLLKWADEHPNILKISMFVEEKDDTGLESYNLGRMSESDIRKALETNDSSKTLVLVCGPDPMINALAGPKSRDGSQGPIGGALGRIPGKFEVWKL